MSSSISLTNLLPANKRPSLAWLAIKLLDRLVGVKRMDRIYQQHQMQGLSKEAFARKLLTVLNVSISGAERLQSAIPKQGPLVIASNHPFGGIEGVILCLLIGEIRPDLKVLANQGLKLFPELNDYFIFTNPLSEKDPRNAPSIRRSIKHVQQGNTLLIFPAGKVSHYQADKHRITDHNWNRVVGILMACRDAQYLPVHVSGKNSALFYRIERVYFKLRMLLLARELLNKRNSDISISCGSAVSNAHYAGLPARQITALCRAQSYAQDPAWDQVWPADTHPQPQPLAQPVRWQDIQAELDNLPAQQRLLAHRDFDVYYGMQSQLPHTVKDIARLRELVFRQHNEGSGAPVDSDDFDATYTQLFVVNRSQQQIVGAYRMGRTDTLLKDNDLSQLYLSNMFTFSEQFVNRTQPCLELGRSFLVPEYQRSFLGLFLLWRGIGAFVCRFPHYRTLYGTVSLSKLYSPRSVAMIEHALVSATDKVTPHQAFEFGLHPELQDYFAQFSGSESLSALLASVEPDSKDIPILAKHYLKLGAKFHCLGIDKNFNHTPGLLLSVDLPQAPEKLLKLYLGKQWHSYAGK